MASSSNSVTIGIPTFNRSLSLVRLIEECDVAARASKAEILIGDDGSSQLKTKEEGENRWGLYHLTGPEVMSWYGFAQKIAQDAVEMGLNLKTKKIWSIPSSEFEMAAERPCNSQIDCSKILRFGLVLD